MSRKRLASAALDDAILAALRDHGPATYREVAQCLGVRIARAAFSGDGDRASAWQIADRLRALNDRGDVEVIGQGKDQRMNAYALTECGVSLDELPPLHVARRQS